MPSFKISSSQYITYIRHIISINNLSSNGIKMIWLRFQNIFIKNVINSATYVTKPPKPEIPKNLIKEVYSANAQTENGIVYDRKPFKMILEAGKSYQWCLCGRSKSQPLCDGTHKDHYLKITQRPIRFQVEKTKEYWMCNCKQTKNRPFCDGTHKRKEIQEATTIRV